jgi:hypothetical protein
MFHRPVFIEAWQNFLATFTQGYKLIEADKQSDPLGSRIYLG